MPQWLDQHRGLLGLLMNDLGGGEVRATGRDGLSAETVVRCALLKQYRQLSYEELAFHLEDSASFIAFARLPLGWSPKKSVLHKTISAIGAETWEAINRTLISYARQEKFEDGTVARIDSTVTEALMHAPSDSSLLWDAVRVMVRLLKQADKLPGGAPIVWRNHRRLAKKRAHAIQHCRGEQRRAKLYRDLIAATRASVAALQQALQDLVHCVTIETIAWRGEVLDVASEYSQRPAIAVPATNATTTILRCVARSALYIEWFISTTPRLCGRMFRAKIGAPRACPHLFKEGSRSHSTKGLFSTMVSERLIKAPVVEAVELRSPLVSGFGITADGIKKTRGQRGIDALEQFEEDEADRVSLRQVLIAAGTWKPGDEPLGSQLGEIDVGVPSKGTACPDF